MDFSNHKIGTAAVWAGETEPFYLGATTPPIVNSVTYAYDDLDHWHDVATGKREGYIYSRNTNPTVREIAKSQMSGFGGMMSFALHGGYDNVKKFLPKLQLVHLAASLGSVSTLAGPPRTTSHVELSEEQRKQLGISESLIRYSVGIEDTEDLIKDLDKALAAI